MKLLFVALVSLATVGANAQEPTNLDEQSIWQAYGKLQTESNFELSLTGYETSYGVTSKFLETLYFTTSIDPRTGQATGAKVELEDFDMSTAPGTMVHRYVGDGKNLWTYDLVNHRLSATFYSYYGNNAGANYSGTDATRMLNQLYKVAVGPASFLVRMMREINPGSSLLTSRYDTWAPGETPGEPLTTPPTVDPLVPTRTYSTLPAEQWVLYGPFSPNPDRSAAFQLDNIGSADSPDWRLTALYYAEKTANKMTDWTLTVTDPIVTQPGIAFLPYGQSVVQGWLPLSSPQPYSG